MGPAVHVCDHVPVGFLAAVCVLFDGPCVQRRCALRCALSTHSMHSMHSMHSTPTHSPTYCWGACCNCVVHVCEGKESPPASVQHSAGHPCTLLFLGRTGVPLHAKGHGSGIDYFTSHPRPTILRGASRCPAVTVGLPLPSPPTELTGWPARAAR